MAVEELKEVYYVTKDGSSGKVSGKNQPVVVPRGELAVAKKFMSDHGATKVALKFVKGRVAYFRKSGRMKKPDQLLAFYAAKKSK